LTFGADEKIGSVHMNELYPGERFNNKKVDFMSGSDRVIPHSAIIRDDETNKKGAPRFAKLSVTEE
jgi:hypothetical protein